MSLTFGQYLRNQRPPVALSQCNSSHILDFLKYLGSVRENKGAHAKLSVFRPGRATGPLHLPLETSLEIASGAVNEKLENLTNELHEMRFNVKTGEASQRKLSPNPKTQLSSSTVLALFTRWRRRLPSSNSSIITCFSIWVLLLRSWLLGCLQGRIFISIPVFCLRRIGTRLILGAAN